VSLFRLSLFGLFRYGTVWEWMIGNESQKDGGRLYYAQGSLFPLSSSQPPEMILNVPHTLSIQFKLYIPIWTTLTNRSDQKKLELIIGDFVKADLPYFDVCISNTPYQVCSFLFSITYPHLVFSEISPWYSQRHTLF
jgi:hypothetical protein